MLRPCECPAAALRLSRSQQCTSPTKYSPLLGVFSRVSTPRATVCSSSSMPSDSCDRPCSGAYPQQGGNSAPLIDSVFDGSCRLARVYPCHLYTELDECICVLWRGSAIHNVGTHAALHFLRDLCFTNRFAFQSHKIVIATLLAFQEVMFLDPDSQVPLHRRRCPGPPCGPLGPRTQSSHQFGCMKVVEARAPSRV